MQISSQTDNHKYRKSVATEQISFFEKMGLKFRNPKFNILGKTPFILFNKMTTLRSSEVSKAILKQVNAIEKDYGYVLRFLKKLKLCTQH